MARFGRLLKGSALVVGGVVVWRLASDRLRDAAKHARDDRQRDEEEVVQRHRSRQRDRIAVVRERAPRTSVEPIEVDRPAEAEVSAASVEVKRPAAVAAATPASSIEAAVVRLPEPVLDPIEDVVETEVEADAEPEVVTDVETEAVTESEVDSEPEPEPDSEDSGDIVKEAEAILADEDKRRDDAGFTSFFEETPDEDAQIDLVTAASGVVVGRSRKDSRTFSTRMDAIEREHAAEGGAQAQAEAAAAAPMERREKVIVAVLLIFSALGVLATSLSVARPFEGWSWIAAAAGAVVSVACWLACWLVTSRSRKRRVAEALDQRRLAELSQL